MKKIAKRYFEDDEYFIFSNLDNNNNLLCICNKKVIEKICHKAISDNLNIKYYKNKYIKPIISLNNGNNISIDVNIIVCENTYIKEITKRIQNQIINSIWDILNVKTESVYIIIHGFFKK